MRLAALSAIAALLLLAPAGAQADYDPLDSGTTKLSLDKGFLALMARNGVKLSADPPARISGGIVSFPVSGGKFDPRAARGTVEHEGALRFTHEGRSLPIRALRVKTTQRRSPISAKAGGGQLKLGAARSMVVSRRGFADRIKVSGLTLSAKVATRLAKKLRARGLFKEGLALGSAVTTANPQTIAVLPRGKASLALDPEFLAKLSALFVAVNPIFPAEHPGADFTLPIFGGTIAPDGSLGTIETQGSLEMLQLGGGQLFWGESRLELATHFLSPEVEVQPSPPYGGKLGPLPVAALALAGPALANPRARTIAVNGAALTLEASTAATLNEIFAKPQGKDGVFAAGEPLGSVSFTAQGQ